MVQFLEQTLVQYIKVHKVEFLSQHLSNYGFRLCGMILFLIIVLLTACLNLSIFLPAFLNTIGVHVGSVERNSILS